MPSGAGHDAQMLARVCPAGMIFVPSVAGISHNPAEHTEPADLAAGAAVLLEVVCALADAEDGAAEDVMLAAANSGPIDATTRGPRRRADARAPARGPRVGADLVVYPELALTTFFPRWYIEDQAEHRRVLRDGRYRGRDQAAVRRSARLGIGFCLGYAELTAEGHRYNTQILVDRDGRDRRQVPQGAPARPRGARAVAAVPTPRAALLRIRPEGFGVWPAFGGIVGMAICNDRRWPETYRVLGLQGVELVLIGYNTPIHYAPDRRRTPRRVPQPPRDAGRRLPERHVGGRRGQGRRRGRRRRARQLRSSRLRARSWRGA